jgi:threonine dehydrogenase-like Zn-dependent dehydrogenase
MHEREEGCPESNARRNWLAAFRPSHALGRTVGTAASYRVGSALPIVWKGCMDGSVAGHRPGDHLLYPRRGARDTRGSQKKKTGCRLFGVVAFKPGDRIYFRAPRTRMGSFAECVDINQQFVAPLPNSWSMQDAASLPLVALTTIQGLRDRASAQPGQSILIHAGSGGLGSFAIQYAKRVLNLQVTTTTSSRNRDWVQQLGADNVIAYDQSNYLQCGQRFDLVFDTLGPPHTARSV